tara:strand:+ start:8539 stop:9159 length:621 start_codon:yes stop_codon:yes gene_type:complete
MTKVKEPISSVFKTLNDINVNEKTEKKGNLTYLSWAWAWSETKKHYPDVSRKVYETDSGMNYFHDGSTAWVKVGVTINGIEHIDYLPIMDFRNKSIKTDQVTSFDVNKAIQRSTTKALALHGLGLYIYAGEDLPENYEAPKPVKESLPKLDMARFEGALNSIKQGKYSKEKLIESFSLTKVQLTKVDDVLKKLETLKAGKNENTKK